MWISLTILTINLDMKRVVAKFDLNNHTNFILPSYSAYSEYNHLMIFDKTYIMIFYNSINTIKLINSELSITLTICIWSFGSLYD